MSPAESVLKQELLATMGEGTYRQHNLSINVLAEQVGHPEHRLRHPVAVENSD